MKNNGVEKRKLRKSLVAMGLSEERVEKAIADTFGAVSGPKLKTIPRDVTRAMLGVFNKLGRGTTLAVAWCKSGKFHIYTPKSYKSMQETGRRVGKMPKKGTSIPIGKLPKKEPGSPE